MYAVELTSGYPNLAKQIGHGICSGIIGVSVSHPKMLFSSLNGSKLKVSPTFLVNLNSVDGRKINRSVIFVVFCVLRK